MKIVYTFLGLLLATIVSAQTVNYEFFDTIRYQDGSFISPNTVLNDISDNGIMVGYYENINGFNSGLVVFPNGTMTTFDLNPFNNTELTGINDIGLVVGKGYNSTNAAEVFQASIVNEIVDQSTVLVWNDPSGLSKDVGKLNDDDVAVGNVRIGNQNWLHYESIRTPFTVDVTKRYAITNPFTSYNTYGLGLNNIEKYSGWYQAGVDRVPFVYDGLADIFFPQSQVLPNAVAPRTFLNDINDNNYMAVSYRAANGQMQGTIGLYNGASTVYDSIFPLISLSNFELLGINDNQDVVGYYQNSLNEKIGLYMLTEGPQINNFNLFDDALLFGNDSAFFQYPVGTFDYYTMDNYLGIQDSFYSNYIADINFVLNAEQQGSINTGIRNPSWRAFVASRDEDRSYITQNNGTQIPREEAIIKWFENSFDEFEGNCYGMSLFALQNLSDPNLLQNRFGNVYPPSPNAVDYFATDILFKEMLTTLQLQQLGDDFNNSFVMQNALNGALADLNYTAIEQLMRPLIFEVIAGLKTGEADSSYIISFKGINANNFQDLYHSVMPFKVTRNIAFGVPGDTLHCIDPNYPGNVLKLYVDYTSGVSKGFVNNATVYFIDYVYHNSYLSDIEPASAVNYHEAVNQGSPKSIPPQITYVQTNKLCDFDIQNMDNTSQSVSYQGGDYNSSWNDLGLYFNQDEDGLIDKVIAEGVLNIESSIQGCQDRNYFSYAHPSGMMIFERKDVLSSETDIIANNGSVQVVTNPDAIAKSVNMIALNSGSSSETLVAVEEYELLEAEIVRLEVLDSTHILLSNEENDDKTYDLLVNYLDTEFHINSLIPNIPLNLETNHTIVIQPEEEGNEVIILVDADQNGTIEDTLFYNAQGPVGIASFQNQEDFNVYPNPFEHSISIEFAADKENDFSVELLNTLGQQVFASPLDFKVARIQTLSLEKLEKGIYILKISDGNNNIVAIQRVLRK